MEGKIIKKRRSKEEIEGLIELYESSGQTIRQWCEGSDIPLSTFSSWLRKRNKKRKDKEVRFINLSPDDAFSKEKVVGTKLEITDKAGELAIVFKLSNCQIYLGDSLLCALGITGEAKDV